MAQLTELYAWLMEDEDDNGRTIEDVMFAETAGGAKFMLTAPKERAEWMEPIAKAIAEQHGRKAVLAKFTKRENLKEVGTDVR